MANVIARIVHANALPTNVLNPSTISRARFMA
jgi:hypothetical protein